LSSGKGYTQIVRTGAFITKITVWEDDSMTKKRMETTISRTVPPDVDSMQTKYYSEDGSTVVATVDTDITRTGDKKVAYIDTSVTRS
jgi:hypothetical protein